MTMVSMAVILLTWQAWIVPPIVVAAAVMFFISARFGSANFHMVMGRTPEARKAQLKKSGFFTRWPVIGLGLKKMGLTYWSY
jgi:hypothetical protein